MRIVSWFSCGAASAVATKLVIQKYGKQNVIVARCIIKEEHPDNERFAKKCEQWFGTPITNLIANEYDGSVIKVIEHRQYISGVRGAPCTYLLKKQVREKFQKPNDKHIFGYTADRADANRFDRFLDANNVDAEAPLIDNGLTHADCLGLLQHAKIDLPVMYKLGYQHNNCIGCVKSNGAGYWNKIRVDFPEQFEQMAKISRKLNVKMIKVDSERIFLDELKEGTGRYQDEPEIQCGAFCEIAKSELAGEQ